MAYPITANWIRFKRISENEYKIINLLHDEEIVTAAYTVWFARQLNGKRNPYLIDNSKSKEDVDLLLEELEAENVIRDKRFFSKFFLFLLVTVWKPKITENFRIASFIINGLLLISFLPLLAFSIFYFLYYTYDVNFDYVVVGSVAGMLIGLVMHELGHMFACLAYGGRVFEVGVMLQFLLMPGAYVLMNESNIKKRMRRVQVSAAGIEMNLLLTAIFLIISARFESLSGFFLGAAIQNVFLALLNLTLVDGFDGMAIMGELLGVENVISKARRITRFKFKRKKLENDGVSGKATIAVCYILRGIQIALPLIFALNIVGVITWFL